MSKWTGVMTFAVLVLALASVKANAEERAGQDIKGSAGCAMCCFSAQTKASACAAAVKVGDKVYTLQASEAADAATKAMVKDCVGAKQPKDVTIHGVIKGDAIIADSVVAAAAPKAEKITP